MLYVVTGRKFWGGWATHGRFFGTALLLGLATLAAAGVANASSELDRVVTTSALGALIFVSVFKLASEGRAIRHQDDAARGELWRSAELITGPLFPLSSARTTLGLIGGIALPGLLLALLGSGSPALMTGTAILMLVLCTLGEFLERTLFFMAVAPLRMPGSFGKVRSAR